MESTPDITIITAGTIGSEASYARLKALMAYSLAQGKSVQIVSQFPGREEPTQKVGACEIPIRYLSFYPKHPNRLISRLLKALVGHIQLFYYILFKTNKKNVLFFYCPMFLTTGIHLALAKFLGRCTVTDVVERFEYERDTWYNRLGDRWAFSKADVPFAISEELIRFGKQYTNQVITGLPIVVDFDRFNTAQKPTYKQIGYVGTSAPKDGLDVVLQGFTEAYKKDKDLRLLLIGPQRTYFNLDEFIAEHSLQAAVRITGSVDYGEVPKYLLDCDTFIMNRDDSNFAKYGYPTKLGEYFACNRSVLLSESGGFSKDFIHLQEAIKYQVNNPRDLADKIVFRYANEEQCASIALAGYQYAKKHFSKENVSEVFYKSVFE